MKKTNGKIFKPLLIVFCTLVFSLFLVFSSGFALELTQNCEQKTLRYTTFSPQQGPYPPNYGVTTSLGGLYIWSYPIGANQPRWIGYYELFCCPWFPLPDYFGGQYDLVGVRETSSTIPWGGPKTGYFLYFVPKDSNPCTWVCGKGNYVVDCATCSASPSSIVNNYNTGVACSQPNPENIFNINTLVKNTCSVVPEICGDGKDNNSNGQVDEECEKILKYVSGNGQEDFICKTLKNPFVVSASGASQGDIGINWLVTNSPSGSSANISQSVTTIEGTETLSSAYLKLGSLPGSYTAEARCAECTSGSPQVFTANAKCPDVLAYYQTDYKDPYDSICAVGINPQTKKKYGVKSCEKDAQGNVLPTEIRYTIADKGCALTSAAMVMNWYTYKLDEAPINPVALNGLMNDTLGGYKDGGFSFDTVKDITNPDLLVYKRNLKKGEKTVPKSEMDEYLGKCIPVVVKVKNPPNSNNDHFVVVTKKVGYDYDINDPGYMKRIRLSEYGEIYAMRVLYNKKGACEQ